jgi:hypothetical protein
VEEFIIFRLSGILSINIKNIFMTGQVNTSLMKNQLAYPQSREVILFDTIGYWKTVYYKEVISLLLFLFMIYY